MVKLSFKAVGVAMSALLVFSAFSGCSSSKTNTDPKNGAATAAPVAPIKMEQIDVWSSGAHEKDIRLKQVEKFNNTIGKEKGIKVNHIVYGNEYNDTIEIALASGQAPHFFGRNSVSLQDNVKAGWIIPFTDLPGGDEWLKKDYSGKLINNVHMLDGKTYSAPYSADTFRFVINKDLFKKAGLSTPPKTWNEVRDYAKKITVAGAGKQFGYALALQSSWTQDVYGLNPIMFSLGHKGFNFTEKKYKFIEFKPFYDTIMDMKQDGSMFPGAEGLDADRMRAQFAEGNIGMLPMPYYDVAVYTTQFPAKIDWEVVPMPTFATPKGFDDVIRTTAWMYLSANAKKAPEKTLEVLKYYYNDENLAEMYMNAKFLPVRDVSKFVTKEPDIKGWSAFKPNKTPLNMPADITGALKPEGDDITTTLTKMLAGSKNDVEKTLLDMDKRFNAALDKEVAKGLKVDDYLIK